jgi:hypothetical protein
MKSRGVRKDEPTIKQNGGPADAPRIIRLTV